MPDTRANARGIATGRDGNDARRDGPQCSAWPYASGVGAEAENFPRALQCLCYGCLRYVIGQLDRREAELRNRERAREEEDDAPQQPQTCELWRRLHLLEQAQAAYPSASALAESAAWIRTNWEDAAQLKEQLRVQAEELARTRSGMEELRLQHQQARADQARSELDELRQAHEHLRADFDRQLALLAGRVSDLESRVAEVAAQSERVASMRAPDAAEVARLERLVADHRTSMESAVDDHQKAVQLVRVDMQTVVDDGHRQMKHLKKELQKACAVALQHQEALANDRRAIDLLEAQMRALNVATPARSHVGAAPHSERWVEDLTADDLDPSPPQEK